MQLVVVAAAQGAATTCRFSAIIRDCAPLRVVVRLCSCGPTPPDVGRVLVLFCSVATELVSEKIAPLTQILRVTLLLQILVHVVPRLVASNPFLVLAATDAARLLQLLLVLMVLLVLLLLLFVLVAVEVRLARIARRLMVQVVMMVVRLRLLRMMAVLFLVVPLDQRFRQHVALVVDQQLRVLVVSIELFATARRRLLLTATP
uniref:Uncharacterized protein n=1 Tax=Anopheles atroparvus TaxID=41427 RepID=A0A182IP64_ANOAO